MSKGKGVPKNSVATIQRRTKAVQLRAAGLTWEEVAQKSGFSSKQAAQKSVMDLLKAKQSQAAEDYKIFELERLDQMTMGLAPKAFKGDPRSVDSMLRIMERRARYLGLDVPAEHNISSGDGTVTVVFDPSLSNKSSEPGDVASGEDAQGE